MISVGYEGFVRKVLPLILVPCLALAYPPWQALRDKVIQADLTAERGDQKNLAKEALKMAEGCLTASPKEIGCIYYRAQALGLSSRSFFGYTGRVRKMLADWETVLAIDPTFDYGGPCRMIAEVYMELPKYFGPKDLRQNLNKSAELLKKAVEISDYPTNWLDLAEVYLMRGNRSAARQALEKAKAALPQWQDYPYAISWPGTISRLEAASSK